MTSQEHPPPSSESLSHSVPKDDSSQPLSSQTGVAEPDHEAAESKGDKFIGDQSSSSPLPHTQPSQPLVDPEVESKISVSRSENDHNDVDKEESGGDGNEGNQYPKKSIVTLVMLSIYLSILLVALDRTIISTAIPRITDQFHALNDVGWYGSSYMLTSCSFQLSFGRLYTYYSPKWVLITAIVLFEIGSAICGAAPNSIVFIVGRAIAGVGSAGIYSGAIIIIVYTVPLRQRPMYTGIVGAVFGVASVAGPLLGGAFTNNVSWRWCFYINLPIGAVTLVVLILVLKLPKPPMASGTGIRQKFMQLDPLGTFFFLPGVVCLLLVLQWGGTTYSWSSARIIALIVIFGVLMIAFALVQIWKKENALLPLHILKRRGIASGTIFSACVGGSMLLFVYYLPIWFQSIKGVDAVKSGVDIIPLLLGLFTASLMAGVLTTLIGYFTPFMILSCIIMSVGAGLLTTLTPASAHPKWIGYQALYGIGTGFGLQQPGVAAQAILPRKDVATASSLVMFAQSLGGAISVSIGGNVYTNRVVSSLVGIPDLDPATVANSGTTELRQLVPMKYLGAVKEAYNSGLTAAFKVGLAFACVSLLGAVGMEWVSVKQKPKEVGQEESGKEVKEPKVGGGGDGVGGDVDDDGGGGGGNNAESDAHEPKDDTAVKEDGMTESEVQHEKVVEKVETEEFDSGPEMMPAKSTSSKASTAVETTVD